MNKKYIIVLLGPQGSGKGTQGQVLAKKKDLVYLETGQLLRDEIKSNSEKGKYIKSVIDGGVLLPDDFVNTFMEEKVKEALKDKEGVVIDGYPRRVGQAEFLDKIVKPTHALLINIPDEESVRRLSARRRCPKDGKIYNLITAPPKKDEFCDDCQTKLEQRADDTPKAIKERLNLYHKDTEPIVSYYKEKNILHKVDGTPSIDEVKKSVWRIFE